MHHHCEVVIPPIQTDAIPDAIESILKPFYEGADDGERSSGAFYDFYKIGGRFAGNKYVQSIGEDRIQEFYDWLNKEKVTVSGLQFGKQELSPPSQIPKVDAKWKEMFGDDVCPLFRHSNDQFADGIEGTSLGDLFTIEQCLESARCGRLIFSGPSYNHQTSERDGPLEAVFMLQDSFWNGVCHIESTWDGSLKQGLAMWRGKLESYRDSYRAQMNPDPDWICVTVDYHS